MVQLAKHFINKFWIMMKSKKTIIFSILFALTFSMVHEYAYAFYDDGHCDVEEYTHESISEDSHVDICDKHIQYHQAYVLPTQTFVYQKKDLNSELTLYKESYHFQITQDFFKPPIA